jgi:hypothetical protein
MNAPDEPPKRSSGDMILRSPARRYAVIAAVTLLTVIGYYLRVRHLGGRGVWWDEAGVWHMALTGRYQNQEAPLFCWTIRAVMEIWRRNDALALHFSAALFGTLIIPAVFLLGRTVAGTACGLVAALLVTFSPVMLYFSQEAKAYSLLGFLTTLQIDATVRLIRDWSRSRLLQLMALTSAVLATHLVGLGVTGALALTLGLSLLWQLRRPGSRRAVFFRLVQSVVGIGVACAIGLSWTLFRPKLDTVVQTHYTKTLREFFFYVLQSAVDWQHPMQITFTRELYVALALVGIIAFVWRRRTESALALVLPCVAVLTGLYLHLGEMSTWPWFRYATPVVVPFLVLVSAGITCLPGLRPNLLLLGGVLACWYADPTGLLIWHDDLMNWHRGTPYQNASADLDRFSRDLTGILFVKQNTTFGEETDRMISLFAIYRTEQMPSYYALPNNDGIFQIEYRQVAGNLPVPFRTQTKVDRLPPGKYAVFYGWDNDRGCGALFQQLVEEHAQPSMAFHICRE